MRRSLFSVLAVAAALAAQLGGLAPARATGGTDLTDGEAMYTLDYSGTSWVATDVPDATFKATGSTPVDTADDYGPVSLAYDAATGATYALEYSAYGRRIEQLDPSTGRRWGSRQIDEPEGNDWIVSIAISPSGAMYGLGDAGGLYKITLGSTTATVTPRGNSHIASPDYGLAFDPSGFLLGYDAASRSINVINLADASTVSSYTTTGLPTGASDHVVSLQVDRSTPDPHVWVGVQDYSDDITSLYVGALPSSGPITFTDNGWMAVAGTTPANPVRTESLLLAPPMHTTALSHAQSAGQVTYGNSVTLSTVLTDTTANTKLGSVAVHLQRRSGSSWVGVKSVATNNSGAASYTLAPSTTTTYRWYVGARATKTAYYAAAASASFPVKVALRASEPTITGTVRAGSWLTAHHGTWAPTGITFRYQWYVGGKAISGATKSTLKLSPSWIGRRAVVHVTGSKTGYVSVDKAGAATKAIAKA